MIYLNSPTSDIKYIVDFSKETKQNKLEIRTN